MRLPRVPQIDHLALAAEGFLAAPVGVHYLAVQDHVRRALGQRPLECLGQSRRPGREHLDDLVQVPVGRGLRQPEPGAQPRDVPLVPEPGQAEQRLPVTAQLAGALPGADLAAAGGQQPGHEQDQLSRDIEHDTIGDHAEPLPVSDDLQRDLFYRELRVFPAISAYVQLNLVGKTSLNVCRSSKGQRFWLERLLICRENSTAASPGTAVSGIFINYLAKYGTILI